MANLTHGCVPASVGGFVYPPDPTLEQLLPTQNLTDRVVIRELIALRERLVRDFEMLYTSGSECEAEFRKRLDALEASASSGGLDRHAMHEMEVAVHRTEAERDEARRERDEFMRVLAATDTVCVERWGEIQALQQQLAALRSVVSWAVSLYPDPPIGNPVKARLIEALEASTPANTEEASS